jgi:hypothetical protein
MAQPIKRRTQQLPLLAQLPAIKKSTQPQKQPKPLATPPSPLITAQLQQRLQHEVKLREVASRTSLTLLQALRKQTTQTAIMSTAQRKSAEKKEPTPSTTSVTANGTIKYKDKAKDPRIEITVPPDGTGSVIAMAIGDSAKVTRKADGSTGLDVTLPAIKVTPGINAVFSAAANLSPADGPIAKFAVSAKFKWEQFELSGSAPIYVSPTSTTPSETTVRATWTTSPGNSLVLSGKWTNNTFSGGDAALSVRTIPNGDTFKLSVALGLDGVLTPSASWESVGGVKLAAAAGLNPNMSLAIPWKFGNDFQIGLSGQYNYDNTFKVTTGVVLTF